MGVSSPEGERTSGKGRLSSFHVGNKRLVFTTRYCASAKTDPYTKCFPDIFMVSPAVNPTTELLRAWRKLWADVELGSMTPDAHQCVDGVAAPYDDAYLCSRISTL